MVVKRLARWFDDRLRASSFAHHAMNKVFPDDWSFMLGEIAFYTFIVLVLTGTFLTFFRGGMVFRQIHHWAALLFVAAIVVHMMRVFFTGAFRRPREINWMIGVTLLLLSIYEGFAGYSMPDDLLSGTGLRIAYSVFLSVPLVGTWLAFLFFGGEFPSSDILRRLEVTHIMIVPGLLLLLIGAHLAILWRQKHTQNRGPGRTNTNVVGSKLFPTYAAKSTGLFFGIAGILGLAGGLFQINPIWLYGPFRPEAVSSPAQPDWYLGWLEGALRIFPPWETRIAGFTIPNPFFPAILLPGFTFTMLYLWPFLEAKVTGDHKEHHLLDRPRDHPLRTAIGVTAFVFYTMLLLAGSNDIVAKVFRLPVGGVTWAFRFLVPVVPLLFGWLTLRWLDALNRTGSPDVLHVPLSALRSQRQARPAPPSEPWQPTESGWALGDWERRRRAARRARRASKRARRRTGPPAELTTAGVGAEPEGESP